MPPPPLLLSSLRAAPRCRLLSVRSASQLSRFISQPRPLVPTLGSWYQRCSSTSSISPSARSAPLEPSSEHTQRPTTHHRPPPRKGEYELTFTCKPCSTRSAHRVSKQGYHHGSVLITCPECRNRHVISDHLGIFGDRSLTIEELMREQGQLVKKGTLSEDGDVEFWADGTQTKRGQNLPGVTIKDEKR